MTLSVSTSAAKGSTLSSRKGFPIAQPTSTITGSTNIAICTPSAANINALLWIHLRYLAAGALWSALGCHKVT